MWLKNRKKGKKGDRNPEDDFWLVDYLDSLSVCDPWVELGFIWQRCLLCHKTESDSDLFVSISLVIGDRADLANRPQLARAFTSKTNKDKQFNTQPLQN